MTSIPLFFSNGDDTIDLVIGKTNVQSYKDLPVPFPKELESEFTSLTTVRNAEVHRTQEFRVRNYDNVNHFVVSVDGDAKTHRYLQVGGNQIKSSSGSTAIELDDQNVKINGELEVDGNVRLDNELRVQNTAEFFANIIGHGNINVTGTITGSAKFFDIPHPSKPNYRIRHGALEGPELAVYLRGTVVVPSHGSILIEYPDYWKDLVDQNTETVHLTPHHSDSVFSWNRGQNGIWVESETQYFSIKIDYLIMATRRDVSPLIIEYENTE